MFAVPVFQHPFELGFVELPIDPALVQQLLVLTLFHDPAPVQDQDLIGRHNGRQAVCDDQAGPGLQEGLDGGLDQFLGDGIQR